MPTMATIPPSPKRHGGEHVSDKIGRGADKSDKAKNVSHVPCKFFRQSMCQAGDKCPFSHEMESETQAVCKYFQKGNCKFGSKCALAHITPDGRQVNKKIGKESRRKERHKDDKKEKSQKHTELGFGDPSAPKVVTTASLQAHPYAPHISSVSSLPSPPSQNAQPLHTSASVKTAAAGHDVIQQHNSKLTPPNTHGTALAEVAEESTETRFAYLSSFSKRRTSQQDIDDSVEQATDILTRYSILGSPPRKPQAFSMRSFSASLPRRESTLYQGLSNLAGFAEGSAILDDDDDALIESKDGGSNTKARKRPLGGSLGGAIEGDRLDPEKGWEEDEEEEEGYREQLVPSTLQDLLTPLERERRNSRNSNRKVGRVNSSPSPAFPSISFATRRGSTGSDTISAQGPSSLWGPRTPSIPFYRNGVFGSPPSASSALLGVCETSDMVTPPANYSSVSKQSPAQKVVAKPPTTAPLSPKSSYYTAASPLTKMASSYRPIQQFTGVIAAENDVNIY